MTTPERLRRRERRNGYALIVLGIVIGLVSIYFHQQDAAQRRCISEQFSKLSTALTVRGDLAKREARATHKEANAQKLESKANQMFYRDAFSSATQAGVFDAYGQYRVTIHAVNQERAHVQAMRERIKAARANTPIPDFPAGTCD